jgi:23S rRNA pseudouridine1911/1915/1917 synthase
MNKFIVNDSSSGERLDKVLSSEIDKSRSYANKLIEEGKIFINGDIVFKSAHKVKSGDEIAYLIPKVKELEVEAENIPLNIVYEDEDIAIINKPQGMVVHPAVGHHNGTLVNALLGSIKNLSGINGVLRPGIVHRIDKDTSGLLVISKNDKAHTFLAAQLKDHTMSREYKALVKGIIVEDDGVINLPISRSKINRQKMAVDPHNGKIAITHFHVEERFYEHTYVSLKLETGRTHQIRVHMSYIGHPIEGDNVYGSKKSKLYNKGQLLHAYRLTLIHPTTKKKMTFECPLPAYFLDVLEKLK